MDSTLKETIEKIQALTTEQTGICSSIARQIAFGLTAATWALLFVECNFRSNTFLLLAIISEILYFILDFMQYLFLSMNYKRLFVNAEKVLNKRGKDITDKFLLSSIQLAKRKANNLSYLFFYLKFPFILVSFLMVLLFVMSKI